MVIQDKYTRYFADQSYNIFDGIEMTPLCYIALPVKKRLDLRVADFIRRCRQEVVCGLIDNGYTVDREYFFNVNSSTGDFWSKFYGNDLGILHHLYIKHNNFLLYDEEIESTESHITIKITYDNKLYKSVRLNKKDALVDISYAEAHNPNNGNVEYEENLFDLYQKQLSLTYI